MFGKRSQINGVGCWRQRHRHLVSITAQSQSMRGAGPARPPQKDHGTSLQRKLRYNFSGATENHVTEDADFLLAMAKGLGLGPHGAGKRACRFIVGRGIERGNESTALRWRPRPPLVFTC